MAAASGASSTAVAAPSSVAVTIVASAASTVPPTTAAPALPPTQPLMPQVVCMNLQDAQDLIQTVGVFYSRSVDATGEGRNQLVDSNWQVVAQSPEPGTPFGEGDALLSVVKIGEQPNPC
ncbi:MAG: PASTA domain-containing protein [Ilumatobacteraceae bacterium]